MKKRTPLEGIRIVDFSWFVTGPLITKFLADYGAEVIKVESASRLDHLRVDGTFGHVNTSKYSISLDLNNMKAREVLKSNNFDNIPVVDNEGRPLGIIDERNIILEGM